jgi:phosphatidylglycerol:prolipoprotein diacylglycerol transferase
MIPFAPEPVIRLGAWHVSAFSALMVAGILVGRTVLMRRARRFGIAHHEMAPLYLTMLIAGLVGAVLAQAIMTRTHTTLEPGVGLASIGGLAAGLLAGIVMCSLRRYSFRQSFLLLDITAFAVSFASCVARLGCALAHDHRGLPSDAWFAVLFPEGPRYDLGLLEFAFLAGLSVLFVVLDRKPRPVGYFFGLAGVLYGAFRLWREALDVGPHLTPWVIVCLIGAAAWVAAYSRWRSFSQIRAPLALQ